MIYLDQDLLKTPSLITHNCNIIIKKSLRIRFQEIYQKLVTNNFSARTESSASNKWSFQRFTGLSFFNTSLIKSLGGKWSSTSPNQLKRSLGLNHQWSEVQLREMLHLINNNLVIMVPHLFNRLLNSIKQFFKSSFQIKQAWLKVL